MAYLISKTERYAYIRFAIDRTLYERFRAEFGGNDNLALRAIRERLTAALARAGGSSASHSELSRVP